MLHLEGESFILQAVFTGGRISEFIPENYYLGLDARSTILSDDTMDSLAFEPNSQYGYQRQTVSSSGGFIIGEENGQILATSPIIAFRATGGSWGPVNDLFLSNTGDNSGTLISSAQFEAPITVADGDFITMRIALMLKDCP